jgi:hypothetical protein
LFDFDQLKKLKERKAAAAYCCFVDFAEIKEGMK